jgi:hypothetical protein
MRPAQTSGMPSATVRVAVEASSTKDRSRLMARTMSTFAVRIQPPSCQVSRT